MNILGSLENSLQSSLFLAKEGKPACMTGYIDGLDNTDANQVIYPEVGAYYELIGVSGGASLSIASGSAADTEIGVTIVGVDQNYVLQTKTVTLDATSGQTKVAIDGTWGGVNVVYPTTGNSAGTIYIAQTSETWTDGVPGANIIAELSPSLAVNLNAYYTVPAGYTLFVNKINAKLEEGSTPATTPSVDLGLFTQNSGGIKKLVRGSMMRIDENSLKDHCDGGWVAVPEKTIISIETIKITGTDNTIVANASGLIVENDELRK